MLCAVPQRAARALTERIRTAADDLWELIVLAYQGKTWKVLGYDTWDDYVSRELGDLKIRLPKEDRREIVCTLRDHGLTLSAIAAATGYDTRTVTRDIRECAPHLAPKKRKPAGCSVVIAPFRKAVKDVAKISDKLLHLASGPVDPDALEDLRRARDAIDRVLSQATVEKIA